MYDERIYVLEKVLGYNIFPTADEIFIYENKRFFSFWLNATKIPHPETNVFYYHKEALDYIETLKFPLVGKSNIGASGRGVKILKSKEEGKKYINAVFKGKGAPKSVGPNFKKGGLLKRGFRFILNPSDIRKKFKEYSDVANDIQKGFVILQNFIPHDFEWRAVRIGDSFFAHKKLKIGEKSSGSLEKNYDNPPLSLLDFTKEITDKYHFYSQAVDVFETETGYLVNEMQCIFGQSDAYQMMVDGKVGRYRFLNNEWVFEEGAFNKNMSYNLRLEYLISKSKNEGIICS
ncbi:MAG: hypothetical protein H0X62_00160 [Bacteroidetes bacterium]|nr:hypothetical protein [Bacteroidota bacterium]